MDANFANIDQYIAVFPSDIQLLLQQMRSAIRQAAPQATETIKYGMPTFVWHGNLVHFAACKGHIGFYPAPSGIDAFRDHLKLYKTSKGAIQFPIDRPLPVGLVAQIVSFRVAENEWKKGIHKQ